MINSRVSVILVLSITVFSQLCTQTDGKYVRRTSRVIEEVDQQEGDNYTYYQEPLSELSSPADVIVDYQDFIAEDDQVDQEIAEVGFIDEVADEEDFVEETIDVHVESIDTEVQEPIDVDVSVPNDEDLVTVDGDSSYGDRGADEETNEKKELECPPMTCPDGTFVKQDCTCTIPDEDPCNACPEGTRCQRFPELMCIDCNCGFCDTKGSSCCEA